jgi:UDP-3-O-[3-hydroxymyristoyl] glucosamine N-acyltransferase
LGVEASIGPYVVIDDDVMIGDHVTLHPHVVIGRGASLGDDVTLHPHVVLYPATQLGDRVILHAGVRIGVDGFGYTHSSAGLQKIPHVGACEIGDDVEIGANSCVDRGSIGRTSLGKETKLDNLVHVAHNVSIGESSFLAAQVGIAGSTSIGKGTLWGGQSGAVDHIKIGDGARVAAQAGLTEDVRAGSTVAGYPARPLRDFFRAVAGTYRLEPLRRRVRELERRLEQRRAETGDVDDDE